MFLYKNKKENEFKKVRSVSKREEGMKILKMVYRTFYYFLVFSFLGTVLYCLFFSPFLAISDVEIKGLQTLNNEDVMIFSERVYNGKYLGMLPKKNYLVFPVRKTEIELRQNFKRIKNIKISKQFPDSVIINIEERKSLLLWCGSKDECFIIDENGFAYSRVALDSKEVKENNLVKIISGEENRQVSEGEKIMDSERVIFFLNASDVFLNNSKIEIKGDINIKSRMAEEVELRSIDGWSIYVSTNFSLNQAAETLRLFLDKEIKDPEDRKKLEYVDLRVENRTYYKFKEEERREDDLSNMEDVDRN